MTIQGKHELTGEVLNQEIIDKLANEYDVTPQKVSEYATFSIAEAVAEVFTMYNKGKELSPKQWQLLADYLDPKIVDVDIKNKVISKLK